MSTDSVATPIGTIGLRDEAESDADFLYGLFAARKLAEMQAMPLDEAGKEQLLRMQYRSMSYTYRTQFPNARFLVLVLDNEPIGRLIVDTDAERVYLVDIALMPQWHGRGTGQALLQELQRQASALGVPATGLPEAGVCSSRFWPTDSRPATFGKFESVNWPRSCGATTPSSLA